MFFFLSLYLQQVNGYTPLRAGLAFLPMALSILAAALLAARLVTRLGVRLQLVIGLLLAAGGLAWMTRLAPSDSYWPGVVLPELLTGTGFGLSFLPMAMGATVGIPPQGRPRLRSAQHDTAGGRRHRWPPRQQQPLPCTHAR